MDTIHRVLEDALERRRREDEILETYAQTFGPEDFRADKARVMRSLSAHFPRAAMQKVFSSLDKRLP